MEYVGEVLNVDQFNERVDMYTSEKETNFYFMQLNNNLIIDAKKKGNYSRYINHSCNPNTETQKWNVNGELRIGIFSLEKIKGGEEITFNYNYSRYG